MPCIHGLDEINCPTCQKVKSSVPENLLKINKLYNNELKPYNPHFEQYNIENEDFLKDLRPQKEYLNLNISNAFPKLNLLNEIPNFKSNLLLDRLKELDITNSDIYEISKRRSLKSPELKLEKEE
ncbi:MAG: hypothetical protein ACFE8A_11140 [Candidatus Hodarchaeota archaeon]